MQQLFIFRHCEDNRIPAGGVVTPRGVKQMRAAAHEICRLSEGPYKLVSSPEPVALESAYQMMQDLRVSKVHTSYELWPEEALATSNFNADPLRVHSLIERENHAQIDLVFVTHSEIMWHYPRHLVAQRGFRGPPLVEEVDHGQGYHFNFVTNLYTPITPFVS